MPDAGTIALNQPSADLIPLTPSFTRPAATLLGIALALAFFAAPTKPLTGSRALMLLPDAMIYAVALVALLMLPWRSLSAGAVAALAAVALFLAIALVEVFNPNVPTLRVGLEGFRKTAHAAVIFIAAAAFIRRPDDLRRVGRWVLPAAALVALYALKQWVRWDEFDTRLVGASSAGRWTARGWLGGYRAVGTLAGPFHLGMLGVALFLLAWIEGSRPTHSTPRAAAWFALSALGAGAVLASQTRTNLVALVILGGGAILLTRRSGTGVLVALALGLIVVSGLFTFAVYRTGGDVGEWQGKITETLSDNRVLDRTTNLQAMLDAIADRPLAGYGMGAAGDTLEEKFGEGRVHFTSHNLALKLMLEMGLPGLLAFALVIAAWFGRLASAFANRHGSPEAWRIQLMLSAIVLPVLFNGLTGSGIEAYPLNFLMWFGLGASLVIEDSAPGSFASSSR